MKRSILVIVLLAAILLGLWGCGETTEVGQATEPTINEAVVAPPEGTVATSTATPSEVGAVSGLDDNGINAIPIAEYEVTSYPIPAENIYTFSYARSFTCPSPKGGYYSCVGGTYLSYTPFKGETIVLCAQSGCEHADFSCPAYMGGRIGNMGEYNGMIYACVTTDSETQIVSHDPKTGAHEVLARRDSVPVSTDLMQQEIDLWLARIAYGKLYYSENIITTTYEYNEYDAAMTVSEESESKYWSYDIETGKNTEIPDIGAAYGAAGTLVYYYEYSNEYLNWLDDLADAPNCNNIPEMFETAQLRLYDTETWEYTVLADKDKDDYSSPSDPAYGYGSKVCYLCGNTLYIADANTGEATPIVTPENKVVNYWMLDNKLFYITNLDDEEKSAYFYFYDLTDKVSVQLENKGNTEYMLFSIGTEGNEYFVETGGTVISKEDFYNENY